MKPNTHQSVSQITDACTHIYSTCIHFKEIPGLLKFTNDLSVFVIERNIHRTRQEMPVTHTLISSSSLLGLARTMKVIGIHTHCTS